MGNVKATDTITNPSEISNMDKADFSNPSDFQCCVCLDLLYKPVVLACGHISCFWCVHKAMHSYRASHCPLCRQPYIYFPVICQLIHHLLLKMEPVAYKIRETEVLEEEKRLNVFSPQLGNSVISNLGSQQELDISSDDVPIVQEKPSSPENIVENGKANQISINDVLCELCNELLYLPGVLNCGHVFCESCLCDLPNEPLKCPVCLSLHPGEFPNVCLDFDHFLQERFPREYAMRKGRAQLKREECQRGESSKSGLHENEKGEQQNIKKGDHFLLDGNLHYLNYGVGCDSCGMYPIIGNRYKCKDCKEAIGFDLCETCYNSNSKLPGRFNQQHRPDHKFEVDDSHMLKKIFSRSFAVEDDEHGTIIYLPEDIPEDVADDASDAIPNYIPDDNQEDIFQDGIPNYIADDNPNDAMENSDDFDKDLGSSSNTENCD